MSKRLVFDIGNNDADYKVAVSIDGKQVVCPYYKRWKKMLERAYSGKLHEKRPTYKDVTVCDEWLCFMSFREWMIQQDWEGKELDKDLIKDGNKVYSPATCIFVDRKINLLLMDCGSRRGKYPQGVSYHRPNGKYMASIAINSKTKNLGYFSTVEDAEKSYKIAKASYILTHCEDIEDRIIIDALTRRAKELLK